MVFFSSRVISVRQVTRFRKGKSLWSEKKEWECVRRAEGITGKKRCVLSHGGEEMVVDKEVMSGEVRTLSRE